MWSQWLLCLDEQMLLKHFDTYSFLRKHLQLSFEEIHGSHYSYIFFIWLSDYAIRYVSLNLIKFERELYNNQMINM